MSLGLWFGITFSILPISIANAVQFHPFLQKSKTSVLLLLYASAMFWGLQFIPLSQTAIPTIITAIDIIVTNIIMIVQNDIQHSPSSTYKFTSAILMSSSFLFSAASILGYVIYSSLYGNVAQSTESSSEFTFENNVVGENSALISLFNSLTLVSSFASVALTGLTSILRYHVTRNFHPRYSNWVLTTLMFLTMLGAITLKTVPTPWNVLFHRISVWVTFTLVILRRRQKITAFYAPLRRIQQQHIKQCAPFTNKVAANPRDFINELPLPNYDENLEEGNGTVELSLFKVTKFGLGKYPNTAPAN